MEKYCIKHILSNGKYLAVLNNGWRYDGSMVVEADNALELEYKLAQARYDDRWVTMQGNHVLIGANERIKAGAGGRLNGRMFGMRFKDYDSGKHLKNGKRAIRVYKSFNGKTKLVKRQGKQQAKSVVDEAAKQQAIANVGTTHNKLLKREHVKELKLLVEKNMTPEQAMFYDKLTKNKAAQNNYRERKKGGYYSPGEDKVHMNMNQNQRDLYSGTSKTGAFMTKFHEEFHQLDEALSKSKFSWDKNGQPVGAPLTDKRTKYGAKISAAIEKDVTNFVNEAIKSYNKREGASIKEIKDTKRLSADVSTIVQEHLKDKFTSLKDRAQIATLTDAIGLHTNGRIDIGSDFWRHRQSYNRSRGQDGATSELWANFAADKFGGGEEHSKVIKQLMPNSMKVCDEVLDEVVDYVNNNW